ncbi:hypothetical protein [Mycolicibacterium sp. A43C]
MTEISEETKQKHVVNAADAREQASEGGYGFLRSEFRRAKPTELHPEGEIFEIPHKDLFDQEQQERWDDLIEERRTYDREPDTLAPDGKTVIAKGETIYPYLKDKQRVTVDLGGKTLKASSAVQYAVVLWGVEGAARANAGGINFNEIEVIWAKQALALEERKKRDSKS